MNIYYGFPYRCSLGNCTHKGMMMRRKDWCGSPRSRGRPRAWRGSSLWPPCSFNLVGIRWSKSSKHARQARFGLLRHREASFTAMPLVAHLILYSRPILRIPPNWRENLVAPDFFSSNCSSILIIFPCKSLTHACNFKHEAILQLQLWRRHTKGRIRDKSFLCRLKLICC